MFHKIYKFSETNNKSPGNYGLGAEFSKHFSNELTAVLLDVYDYWGKLGTMGVTSRTGISMIFNIKMVIKKILQNYKPISTYTIKFTLLILKNRMEETLDTIIG